jgi:hypothetical protein
MPVSPYDRPDLGEMFKDDVLGRKKRRGRKIIEAVDDTDIASGRSRIISGCTIQP